MMEYKKEYGENMIFKKMKENGMTRKELFFGGMKSFVVILLAGFLILTGMTFGDYREASLTEVTLSGISELVMLDNETEAVQTFRAKYPKLSSIYVYFANEHEGKNAGNVIFTVLDREENQIAQATVEASSIVNKNFTKIELDQTLRMGEEYRLIVSGEGLTAGNAPILYREKNSVGNNNAMIGEQTFAGKMEVRYYYPAETAVQVILIMAAAAALIALVLVDIRKWLHGTTAQMACRAAEEVLFFTAPVIAFFIMEHFTYNSILDIYPVAIGLNLALYYCIYFGIYMLINNRKVTLVGTLLFSYILGAANYFVLSFRGTPILPTDIASLTTAMNVAENYTYTINSAFFTNALIFFFVCILFCRISRTRKMNLKRRAFSVLCVVLIATCTGAVIKEESFLSSYNVKADIWNQKRGFSRDGALASFCLNVKYLYAEKPDGYSVDRVREIAETYIWNEKETASLNGMSSRKESRKTNTKKSSKQPNIIMIMNEAFSDLEVINEIETNQDYMPFIHSLEEDTIKGNLFVSIFGSGTCNSEFEVLTGNSMAFLPSGSIGYTQFVKDAMPNLTQTLKAQNYTGNIALHPYLADGWNRETVYPYFGFEQFLSQDDFDDPEMIRKYISDSENYKKVIEMYEENRQTGSEDPFYLFTVTMQNHGGFSKDYGNLEKEIEITDEAMKDDQAEQYLSLIKKSDDAFRELVEYFKEQDEPTLIIMYGDHQPGIHDEFYEKLYGKDLGDLELSELQDKYQVPFVIWANYDIEEATIPALSANYLASYVLETAGLEMTPYQRYLYDLSKKIPVINAVGYIGDDGQYYEHGDESPYQSYIENYEILQYNNVIDYENRYTSFFTTETLVD